MKREAAIWKVLRSVRRGGLNQKHIERLKDVQHLRRVGPDKDGHWEVSRRREGDSVVDNTINDDRYHKSLSRGRAASRDAEPSVSKALLQALSTREAASPDAKELFAILANNNLGASD